jgi:hypothetical protein
LRAENQFSLNRLTDFLWRNRLFLLATSGRQEHRIGMTRTCSTCPKELSTRNATGYCCACLNRARATDPEFQARRMAGIRRKFPNPRRKRAKARVSTLGLMGRPRAQIFLAPRDGTIEGRAAEVLRAYAPTYRCNEIGRQDCADERKCWWRYGNVVLTPDEMMQRAAAKGWAPEPQCGVSSL